MEKEEFLQNVMSFGVDKSFRSNFKIGLIYIDDVPVSYHYTLSEDKLSLEKCSGEYTLGWKINGMDIIQKATKVVFTHKFIYDARGLCYPHEKGKWELTSSNYPVNQFDFVKGMKMIDQEKIKNYDYDKVPAVQTHYHGTYIGTPGIFKEMELREDGNYNPLRDIRYTGLEVKSYSKVIG
ncbi:hypothetical protein [Paenibacillus medicaginis]|uniref:Uncharacterized protein n=1 Tax=Paenibacillus medicaginis TaxID=1470560 RepID=A0ABV5BUV2_9BACL